MENNPLQIHILYQNNPLRNFNYLLACPITQQAVIIDPLNAEQCLTFAQQHNLTLTTIINTHEHWDHIQGNEKIVHATGAKIIAHANAQIPNISQPVHANDMIQVGETIQLKVLDTPGHTFTHICLFNTDPNSPALFSGDTLFNAGAGNCHSGDMDMLYKTFTEQLYLLPDNTNIYPGHDYLENNLRFALSREPHNLEIKNWLTLAEKQDSYHPLITTLAIEKQINPFFRLSSPEIIQKLQHDILNFTQTPSHYNVFIQLRKLRNLWCQAPMALP